MLFQSFNLNECRDNLGKRAPHNFVPALGISRAGVAALLCLFLSIGCNCAFERWATRVSNPAYGGAPNALPPSRTAVHLDVSELSHRDSVPLPPPPASAPARAESLATAPGEAVRSTTRGAVAVDVASVAAATAADAQLDTAAIKSSQAAVIEVVACQPTAVPSASAMHVDSGGLGAGFGEFELVGAPVS
jgi:hypothetical protein